MNYSIPRLLGYMSEQAIYMMNSFQFTSRLLKKGIQTPKTARFRTRLNAESTSYGC